MMIEKIPRLAAMLYVGGSCQKVTFLPPTWPLTNFRSLATRFLFSPICRLREMFSWDPFSSLGNVGAVISEAVKNVKINLKNKFGDKSSRCARARVFDKQVAK